MNIYGPPWLHFEPLRLLNIDFDEEPDLPFNFNAGPAFQSDADLDTDPALKIIRIGIHDVLDPVPTLFFFIWTWWGFLL